MIHVAGTKGKGSTSSFISYILAEYLPPAPTSSSTLMSKINKIGLYTSPHLRFARERIQINNQPLTETQFAHYFFEIWDRLEASALKAGQDPKSPQTKPMYFRYLTLMAFYAFLSEGVDAAVIECGIGGEYDSTNIIPQPVVSAITSLGIDHIGMLGSTVEEIAWHKGGIIKPGAKAITASQPSGALDVLRKRAAAHSVELIVAESHSDLTKNRPVKLGLAGDFQYMNAAVAVAAAGEFLRVQEVDGFPKDVLREPLPEKFKLGLESTKLGGRCETRIEKYVSWYIDGGHTLESIKVAGHWFASQVQANDDVSSAEPSPRVLIFNQQTRDSNALARSLHRTLIEALKNGKPFTHAIFCTNVTYKDSGYRPDLVSVNTNASDIAQLSVQTGLAETWNTIDPDTRVLVKGTIEEAVEYVRELAKTASRDQINPVKVLVTGSLHLVGGFLDVIETKPDL